MSTSKRKQAQRQAVQDRLESALQNLYHNATPNYPVAQNQYESELFNEWFEDAARDEIEYIGSGGAYGNLAELGTWVYGNALTEGHSEAYARHKRAKLYQDAAQERERCNDLDTHGRTSGVRFNWKNGLTPNRPPDYALSDLKALAWGTDSLWEYISHYGKLYQYGRGGRMLAPDELMGHEYHEHPIHADEWTDTYEARVTLCRVLESFNRHVGAWCEDVPEQWREYKAEEELQPAIDAHDGMKPRQHTITEWVKA